MFEGEGREKRKRNVTIDSSGEEERGSNKREMDKEQGMERKEFSSVYVTELS